MRQRPMRDRAERRRDELRKVPHPLGFDATLTRNRDGSQDLALPVRQQVCDFCLSPKIAWSFPCGEVRIVGSPIVSASHDDWAACEGCHDAIVAEDVPRLVQRMVDGQRSRRPAPGYALPPLDRHRAVARKNAQLFMAARTGPPFRETPTEHAKRTT